MANDSVQLQPSGRFLLGSKQRKRKMAHRVNPRARDGIAGLKIDEPKVYKAKMFACKALKGKGVQSGIRVIYAYFSTEDVIEFVEIYYKGDKENEDKERISRKYMRISDTDKG